MDLNTSRATFKTCFSTCFFISNSDFYLSLRLLREDISFMLKIAKIVIEEDKKRQKNASS